MSPAAATWTSLAALAALALAHVIGAPSARAATIYAQDFDALAAGDIAGQDGWLAPVVGSGGVTVQGVVAVQGKALEVDGEARRFDVFGPVAASPQQRVTFSYRLDETIASVLVPGADVQHGVHILGPVADQQAVLVYKGVRDDSGTIVRDRLEMRGAQWLLGPAPDLGVWYDVQIDLDYSLGTADLLMTRGGLAFWDPAAVLFLPNGNVNMISFTSDEVGGLFVDGLRVEGSVPVTVPEPGALGLVALAAAGAGAARRRALRAARLERDLGLREDVTDRTSLKPEA